VKTNNIKMKRKLIKCFSIIFVTVLVVILGTGTQYYWCLKTAHIKITKKIAFVPVKTDYKDSEVSKWLADEFNFIKRGPYAKGLMNYTFLSFDDRLVATPPGMWMSLRSLKRYYENDPNLKDEIKAYLLDVDLNREGWISPRKVNEIISGANQRHPLAP